MMKGAWEMLKIVVAFVLIVWALCIILGVPLPHARAAKPVRHGEWTKPPRDTWTFQERRTPAMLADCPPQTRIVINYSSSIYGPYQSFCSWS